MRETSAANVEAARHKRSSLRRFTLAPSLPTSFLVGPDGVKVCLIPIQIQVLIFVINPSKRFEEGRRFSRKNQAASPLGLSPVKDGDATADSKNGVNQE